MAVMQILAVRMLVGPRDVHMVMGVHPSHRRIVDMVVVMPVVVPMGMVVLHRLVQVLVFVLLAEV